MKVTMTTCANGRVRQYHADETLSADCTSRSEHPVVAGLMAIPGVQYACVNRYEATVEIGVMFEWNTVEPQIITMLETKGSGDA